MYKPIEISINHYCSLLKGLQQCFQSYSVLSDVFPLFTKYIAVIHEVTGMTIVTPIPAQKIVIISPLKIFELIISPGE